MLDKPFAIRLDADILERIDRIATVLSAKAAGAPVSRSVALRVALDRGLASLETEFQLSKPKRKH
jgi:hypothetical protein